ncbi:MAG: carbamoyltransferase, partial [Leptospiraceae bacterium]|nr:carbamoyltransferase [Leptospiraceae bacterium]
RLVKKRDFWMPFTPSIRIERVADYVINPDGFESPYMALSFDSTDLAREHLKAAIHPADQTLRLQAVYEHWNPEYYAIILEFERLTGIGGILNTSFNLHGEPNVSTARDAVRTVDQSGLNYLILGDFLLKKRA